MHTCYPLLRFRLMGKSKREGVLFIKLIEVGVYYECRFVSFDAVDLLWLDQFLLFVLLVKREAAIKVQYDLTLTIKEHASLLASNCLHQDL